jgi:hypothetical protein
MERYPGNGKVMKVGMYTWRIVHAKQLMLAWSTILLRTRPLQSTNLQCTNLQWPGDWLR